MAKFSFASVRVTLQASSLLIFIQAQQLCNLKSPRRQIKTNQLNVRNPKCLIPEHTESFSRHSFLMLRKLYRKHSAENWSLAKKTPTVEKTTCTDFAMNHSEIRCKKCFNFHSYLCFNIYKDFCYILIVRIETGHVKECNMVKRLCQNENTA